ncbi:MAG: SpoIIE family protein phosphatase, partial [Planctomycetota bacterium]
MQRSLTINVVLGVVALGVILLIVAMVASRRVESMMAQDLTLRALRDVELAGSEFLRPIEHITTVAEEWAQDGWFERRDRDSLVRAMRGVIEGTAVGITGVHTITPDGVETFLTRTEGGELCLRTDHERPGTTERIFFPDDGEPEESRIDRVVPDPREQDWYADAVAELRANPSASVRERRVVSQLRPLPETGRQGFIVSIAIPAAREGEIVIAYDVIATEVLDYFDDIRIRRRGEMAVFALDERRGVLQHFAATPDDPENVVLSDLRADSGPAIAFVRDIEDLPESSEVRRFEYQDEAWWGALEASDRGVEREIWYAAVVPERELLGITDPFIYVIIVTVIVVALASVRARVMSARYAGPVRALVDQSERMARLDFNQSDPIRSDIREIEILARAQDRTRSALESFTATDEEVSLARAVREFDRQRIRAVVGGHEIAVSFAEGEQPACELALAVGVVESPGSQVRSLLPPGQGHRTLALHLSAPTTALDGAMLARELTAVVRQSARVRHEPALVLLDLDRYCREWYPDLGLVSAVCLALDAEADTVDLAAAGDPVAFVTGAGDHEILDLTGPSLGHMSDVETPVTKHVTLPPGAVLLV